MPPETGKTGPFIEFGVFISVMDGEFYRQFLTEVNRLAGGFSVIYGKILYLSRL